MKLVRTFKAAEQVSAAELKDWSQKTGASLDDVRLQDVQVTVFLQREHAGQAERHFRAAFAGIKWFGLMYGKYPFDVLTVVEQSPSGSSRNPNPPGRSAPLGPALHDPAKALSLE